MTSKPNCPADTTVYYEKDGSSDYFFCTRHLNTSRHPNAQILGGTTLRGYVFHYGPEVSSAAEAENYCLNYVPGPSLNSWRLVSTGDDDPSRWKAAAVATFARYGHEGNLYVRLNPATHMWEAILKNERVKGKVICTYKYTDSHGITYEP